VANEIRSRTNLVSGTLSVALAAGDVTMSAAGLANLPVIGATNHAVIVIENEIIYVTAHTAAATTATILRAQEGTSAASHALNTAWVHGSVVSDFDSVLGYAQVTAIQSGITTVVDLTSLTVTVTVPYAAHRVKISAHCLCDSSVAGDVANVSIQEGATVLQIGKIYLPLSATQYTMHVEAVVVPTAASHTYKLTMVRDTGSGNLRMVAGATFPAFILVEDLGPAL
jgi:hypothetical protein